MKRFFLAASIFLVLTGNAVPAWAIDDECGTVKDCAQQMVKLANRLISDNEALTKRVLELEQALKKQSEDVPKAIEARADKLKTGDNVVPSPVGNTVSASCPAGSFMIAIQSQLDSGGPHGITSWIQPVCRTMK